ncbi:IS1182 family transposase [Dysgonomonas termitidis]
MLGKKHYEEKLFLVFRLSDRVPDNNFYRRLKNTLDLSFLRKKALPYYGREGQASIDPEVFFKLMLIGYIENLSSDRKIIEHASMRMDMLYFLNYNVDEPLPWHSTLSRTRQLYGEDLFLDVFAHILYLCFEAGMVEGRSQAIDSAFVKANASMESLVDKEVQLKVTSSMYYQDLCANEQEHKSGPQFNNSSIKPSNPRHGQNKKRCSSTDPQARLSRKPHKALNLNYLAQISVDTSSHVICGALASLADKRDSLCLPDILAQARTNLYPMGITISQVLADTNYSSGRSLRHLEDLNIQGYIPCMGNYLPKRTNFTFHPKENYYQCYKGVKLPFKYIRTDHRDNTRTRIYESSGKDCKDCSLKAACLGKKNFKHLEDTIDKAYYDRMYQRIHTPIGKRMIKLRSSTVEPVLGTLLHYRGMKKVYTKGIKLANKHVLLASMAYNIKKLLSYIFSPGFKEARMWLKNLCYKRTRAFLDEYEYLFYNFFRLNNNFRFFLMLVS